MIAFDMQRQQSPDDVLAALHSRAGEWRESHIPAELRRAGVLAVESRANGATVTLRYVRSWYGLGARDQSPRARAMVSPAGGGASIRVVVDHHYPVLYYAPVCAGGALFIVMAFVTNDPFALLPLILPVSFVVGNCAWSRHVSRGILRSDPDADYLVRRIEDAVIGTPAVLAG
jgi:hypothetical protein